MTVRVNEDVLQAWRRHGHGALIAIDCRQSDDGEAALGEVERHWVRGQPEGVGDSTRARIGARIHDRIFKHDFLHFIETRWSYIREGTETANVRAAV